MRQAAIGAIIVLAGTGALTAGVIGAFVPPVSAQSPASESPGIPVTACTVAAADVPVFFSAIGTVQAYNMVTIKSRVDGQITKIAFAEGQEVKAGDPLIQIDPRPYQASLDQATANQEKDLANLANAQRNLARDAAILKSNLAVSQQQYDNDKATVAADQGLVDSDKAAIEAARLNVGYTDIRAPIDGRLGLRLVDVGNMVRATDSAGLVTITQLKPIFVSFTVPQENLHKIHEKQTAGGLTVLAYGDDNTTQLAAGRLTVIDNAIDQPTGTIRLKAVFDNADERLWPGEFVNVRLILSVRKGAATVPAQTVQDGPDGSFAYVIKQDNTVERRPVEVAAVQDGIAVIAKGLSLGDRVVVEGQYRLTNGARVKIEATAPGGAG
jgi:membrane fusion protein, multidrug efflux system